MNKELYEFKEKLLGTGLFKAVTGSNWYRVKECPFCGDIKWHMYVCINLSSDDAVGYNCFKCGSKGYIKKDFLKYYCDVNGIDEAKVGEPFGALRRKAGQ